MAKYIEIIGGRQGVNECTFFPLEAVLHFMTGCTATEESAVVSQDVVKVLVLSGLMKW